MSSLKACFSNWFGFYNGFWCQLISRQATFPVALQIGGPGRADDAVGRAVVHAPRLGRVDPLGSGAERGQVSEPDQVHRTLQQYELLVQVSDKIQP